jgi:type II secretion system protein J
VRIKQHGGRGFTLIEMILAVGITALVLITINVVLFSALHLRDKTQAMVNDSVPAVQALTMLRRDIECIVPPNGVLSGDFKVGTVTSLGLDEPVAIEMFTATGALSDAEPWGDIQRVTYALKNPTDRSLPGKDLIRSITRNLLTITTPTVTEQKLMSGIESMTFSCYDGSQWQQTWDTTAATTGGSTNLPLAVRVEIQMAGNNNNPATRLLPIQIVVPIDSQSRTNS